MSRFAHFTAVLLVLAGCSATPAGDVATPVETPTPTDSPTSTDSPTPTESPTPTSTAPSTSSPSNETARTRAIAAEKARIRDALAGHPNLTDLSFGVLRPAEAEVIDRNATGVLVAVTVGYSVSFDAECSYDGAATETRYLVTAERTRLIAVERGVLDARGC